ncbi:ATP-binding cassette domain-containing protein [Petropleomorpha daqingensis]|uniref:ABC-type multidrug transport system ATPase subunit n=1 Tax=Petropleomorpha daqingensis TaxID=2026353 RepID=A0A853CLQ4_9ACTN|nr:ATP-binding cassette domain-containing protein [Petropleomorpha daqingensis]NYJ07769.1 ABC-type multidrug transport system ATPase subunit [Petropleomorpha daqingensis]
MTGAEPWLGELTRALRRENLDGWHVDQVIAETRAHLAESGEQPESAFGTADAYARVVAAEFAGTVEPASVAPPRLVVEGITKSYRRRPVLDGVDLVVAAGEVVAVVGPNGAGKSTLLRICAGLESPDAGRVTVHGALGYCPQQPALVDLLRADEHFELVGAGRGLSRHEARRAGAQLAGRLDWRPDRRTAGELSGGTRQKLNVVLAGLGDPAVLLLDEPYQGFDGESFLDFWEQVWHWRDEGRAVVVVTHRPEQLKRVDAVLDLGRQRVGVGERSR